MARNKSRKMPMRTKKKAGYMSIEDVARTAPKGRKGTRKK